MNSTEPVPPIIPDDACTAMAFSDSRSKMRV